MNSFRLAALLAAAATPAACGNGGDMSRDTGIGGKHLSQLTAGIWIDPNDCDHWIIDDGAEGYLSSRLDKYGKPVCSGAGAPSTAVGPYKSGSRLPDLL